MYIYLVNGSQAQRYSRPPDLKHNFSPPCARSYYCFLLASTQNNHIFNITLCHVSYAVFGLCAFYSVAHTLHWFQHRTTTPGSSFVFPCFHAVIHKTD